MFDGGCGCSGWDCSSALWVPGAVAVQKGSMGVVFVIGSVGAVLLFLINATASPACHWQPKRSVPRLQGAKERGKERLQQKYPTVKPGVNTRHRGFRQAASWAFFVFPCS